MMTRAIFLSFSTLISPLLLAQVHPLPSRVYNWDSLKVEKTETREQRKILEGSTTDLEYLEIHASTQQPGMAPQPGRVHNDVDELIIVKEGKLKVTIKSENKILGPGSIAMALAGDEIGVENADKIPVTYYVLKFRSKAPMDADRGKKAGGSFMVDWNDVAVTKTDRGERRQLFDRPTAMFGRFEMHVTTLNKGFVSHAPHTHRAEEIILLIQGHAEMQIGETHNTAEPGAVVLLNSQVLHALKNTGDGPCQYFAFQWQ